MSDSPVTPAGHTGPIQNPKQLLLASLFAFVVPIFAIIGLVTYVTSDNKPAEGSANAEQQIADRLQRIGVVEIRDANRVLKSGEAVFKAQCAACHAAGVAGAPKLGDTAAWAPRIRTGFEALWNAALKGKGAMGPQAGGDHDDVEIGRAVVYLTNAAGATFAEPQPAAPAAEQSAEASATAPVAAAVGGTMPSDAMAAQASGGASTAAGGAAPMATPATVVAQAPPPGAATVAQAAAPAAVKAGAATATAAAGSVNLAAGEALYKQACFACHAAGVAGAPKFGDKTAWAPRLALGVDALTASVIKGKGAMPPKGGSSGSDADIRASVVYMLNAVK